MIVANLNKEYKCSIFKQIEDLYYKLCSIKKDCRYKHFNPFVKDAAKYFPFECVFDFEAILPSIEENDTEDIINKKLKIIIEHVPVSVSIFSNVPGYNDKPIFICNNNPEHLIDDFVKTIYEISLKSKSINEVKYKDIIEFLEAYLKNTQDRMDEFIEKKMEIKRLQILIN